MNFYFEKWVPFLILCPWGALFASIGFPRMGLVGFAVQIAGMLAVVIANLTGGKKYQ